MTTSSLNGLMQSWPLTTDRIIDHAARWHADQEVVSRLEDGATDRRGYRLLRDDAKRLSNALLAYGIRPGDRVATMAMNGAAHLAAWYAISGIGAVCHTLNPRHSEAQLRYIINHAGDRLLLADGAFAPIIARLLPDCPGLEHLVFLSPPDAMPPAASLLADFTAGYGATCSWGDFGEEIAAGLCYTSGTTGDPKGVLYSHRSNFLHSLMSIQPDTFALSARDTIMPIVPMYHANAWGLTFSAPYVGAKLVLPGARLDAESICALIVQEAVTFAAAVPTIWLSVVHYLRATGTAIPSLKRVIVGGAALPELVLREFHEMGIEAVHAWGMTELSPIGGVSVPTAAVAALPYAEQLPWRLKQGRSPGGVEMRIVDPDGCELPHDGVTMGALQLRGPAVASGYFGRDGNALTADGFFDSGDIATIDAQGFMKITDRAKDIIKSGGEWISSIDIETTSCSYPAVAFAAVIGVAHPKWDERPLLFVQLKPDAGASAEQIREHLFSRLPKWWVPDQVRFIDVMPLGSTGKIDKQSLRDMVGTEDGEPE